MTEMIKGFEDLDVFKRAYHLSLEVHRVSSTFPKEERYDLTSQLRRASKSICANVAEGYAKQHISKAEFKRYLLIALGSSEEMRVWIRYCLDLGYISEEQWKAWRCEYIEISKMLSGLHKTWR